MNMETKSKEEIQWNISLLPNPGQHPRLKLSISFTPNHPSSSTQPKPIPTECIISILFKSINPALFFDRFQLENLSQEKTLESQLIPNPSIITSHDSNLDQFNKPISWGSRDLESPISLATSSSLLLPLPTLTNLFRTKSKGLVEVEVPFHLRYLNPIDSWNPSSLEINLTSPLLVWSCDRSKPLDYEPIINTSHPIQFLAPTGNQNDLIFIELITTLIIWISFLWIGSISIRSFHQIKIKSS